MVRLTNWGKMPTALPDGSLMPALRAQDFVPLALKCWRDAGGEARWTTILSNDADKFHELGLAVTKKTMPNFNVTASVGIEDMLEQLEQRKKQEQRTIDAIAQEVEDAA